MKKQLVDFLRKLETAAPPPVHAHHCITVASYGSDDTGWVDDKLVVQVNIAGTFLAFFLEDEDLEKDAGLLATEIASLAAAPTPGYAQLGISAGQYVR